MAERGALGESRGARGVLDVDRVLRGQPGGDLLEFLLAHRFGGRPDLVPGLATDEDDPLERRDLVADLLDHRGVVARLERRCRDEDLDAGLVEDVLQFVGAVGRVDVDEDRADLRGGVLNEGPLAAVGRPDADPVALDDADPGEPAGQPVDVGGEPGIRPTLADSAVDHRFTVGEPRHCRVEVGGDGLVDEGEIGLAGRDRQGHGGCLSSRCPREVHRVRVSCATRRRSPCGNPASRRRYAAASGTRRRQAGSEDRRVHPGLGAEDHTCTVGALD